MQNLLWTFARRYARLHVWVKDHTGVSMKGLSIVLRRFKSDRVFEACGFRWRFDHRIATTYRRLIGGSFSEPETVGFLTFIADRAPEPITFIDVGANIGEMVTAMAARPKVQQVVAFEPHPVCVQVCESNLALNGLRADVRRALIGDGTPQPYVIDMNYAPTSGIRWTAAAAPLTTTLRLDDCVQTSGVSVLLIDVEGAELAVMNGGRLFIRQQRPLIVFEYVDQLQRPVFTLADVREVIGEGYQFYRLRLDGLLDQELTETWNNCVAVHCESAFAPLCREKLRR